LAHLSPAHRRRIVKSATSLEATVLDHIVVTVVEHELWEEAELIAAVDPELEARLGVART
jgi:hypothetical protein